MTDTPQSTLSPVWIVIPAAGRGERMGGALPKQYMPLAGKTLLQVTLDKMAALSQVTGVVVALDANDRHWQCQSPEVHRVEGGSQRAHSVLNALDYLLARGVEAQHWVLVHDAARPCVRPEAIARLRHQVERQAISAGMPGGLLAKPVADTLKRVSDDRSQATVARESLWQAHTPQMFRLGDLQRAISNALQQGLAITDEASAIEYCGAEPIVVEDWRDNIKITHPEDLPLAEMILRRQQDEQG